MKDLIELELSTAHGSPSSSPFDVRTEIDLEQRRAISRGTIKKIRRGDYWRGRPKQNEAPAYIRLGLLSCHSRRMRCGGIKPRRNTRSTPMKRHTARVRSCVRLWTHAQAPPRPRSNP